MLQCTGTPAAKCHSLYVVLNAERSYLIILFQLLHTRHTCNFTSTVSCVTTIMQLKRKLAVLPTVLHVTLRRCLFGRLLWPAFAAYALTLFLT